MKAKPRASGPDGVHNNLLKHLPEETLKILKEILNKIWISADFPQQWRAATVILIPKPNKAHTDPLKLPIHCTDQLSMQSFGAHDKYPPHLVSWKIQDTKQKPVWF